MNGLYVLDEDGEVRAEPDVRAWGRWLDEHGERRRLARTAVGTPAGDAVVSTVFLGLDHNFVADGPPILWETVILHGVHRGYMQRYSTKYAALKGHQHIVEALGRGQFEPYTQEPVEVVRLAKALASALWDAPE